MPTTRLRSNHPLPVVRSYRELGRHFAAWRKLRHLTQEQLAQRAGVSAFTVGQFESGKGNVTLLNVLSMAWALGVINTMTDSLDPLNSDVGRARSGEQLPRRVRPRGLP